MDEAIATLRLIGWEWLDSDLDALSLAGTPYWIVWKFRSRPSVINFRCTYGDSVSFPRTDAGWAQCLELAKERTMERLQNEV